MTSSTSLVFSSCSKNNIIVMIAISGIVDNTACWKREYRRIVLLTIILLLTVEKKFNSNTKYYSILLLTARVEE